MASPHRSKNEHQEEERYPKRARKERTFFLEQREVSKGLLEFQVDEGRGLEQPDSLKLTTAQILDKQLRGKGTELFSEYLSPRGWEWVKRTGGFSGDCRSGEYVWRAPGVKKPEEAVGFNMFPSYQAIAEQYEQDGQTVDFILARARNRRRFQPVNDKVKLEEEDSSDGGDDDDEEGEAPPLKAPNPPAADEESSSSIRPGLNKPVVNVKFQGDDSSDEDKDAPPPQAPCPLAGESSEDDVPQEQDQAPPHEPSSSSTLNLRERLSRIETALGGYSSDNRLPCHRRIEKLEDDCGVTPAPPPSLKDRVSNLEKEIGL